MSSEKYEFRQKCGGQEAAGIEPLWDSSINVLCSHGDKVQRTDTQNFYTSGGYFIKGTGGQHHHSLELQSLHLKPGANISQHCHKDPKENGYR